MELRPTPMLNQRVRSCAKPSKAALGMPLRCCALIIVSNNVFRGRYRWRTQRGGRRGSRSEPGSKQLNISGSLSQRRRTCPSKANHLIQFARNELLDGWELNALIHHSCLLAMARLSLLPLEIESGRWAWVQRYDRLCRLEFDAVEGLAHFLTECGALTSERVG